MQIQKITTINEIENIRTAWEAMQEKEEFPKISTDINWFLNRIELEKDKIQPCILLLKKNDDIVTIVIGYINKIPYECKIGRKTVSQPLFKCFNVAYHGIIGEKSESIYHYILEEIKVIYKDLNIDIVKFNHLADDSLIYKVIKNDFSIVSRNIFAKKEVHWYLQVPDSIQEFYDKCSKNRRKKYNKYNKIIKDKFNDTIKLNVYSKEDEVDEALSLISGISSQTYQRAFGGGIVKDDFTTKLLKNAAKNGWLKLHVLFVDNKPCAFKYGLRYKNTHYAEITGYLPEMKEYNIGHVLFIKFLEEVCSEPEVKKIDFGFGDSKNKQIEKDNYANEMNIYLFAPRIYPIAVNIFSSLCVGISLSIQYITKHLGIYNHVQRYRRKRMKEIYDRESGSE